MGALVRLVIRARTQDPAREFALADIAAGIAGGDHSRASCAVELVQRVGMDGLEACRLADLLFEAGASPCVTPEGEALMEIRPLTLRQAGAFVAEHHRHARPARGHKFSLGLFDGEDLIGVACAGRPVARALDDGRAIEIDPDLCDRWPRPTGQRPRPLG